VVCGSIKKGGGNEWWGLRLNGRSLLKREKGVTDTVPKNDRFRRMHSRRGRRDESDAGWAREQRSACWGLRVSKARGCQTMGTGEGRELAHRFRIRGGGIQRGNISGEEKPGGIRSVLRCKLKKGKEAVYNPGGNPKYLSPTKTKTCERRRRSERKTGPIGQGDEKVVNQGNWGKGLTLTIHSLRGGKSRKEGGYFQGTGVRKLFYKVGIWGGRSLGDS